VGLVEKKTDIFPEQMNSYPVCCGNSRERTVIFPEHMNSPPVLCRTSRERTPIFPQGMSSCVLERYQFFSPLVPNKTGGEFMCSGKIGVLSLLPEHMNSPSGLCGTSRGRTAIFPEHMNSPSVLCGTSGEKN
jgi:hypothetical protein